MKKNLLSLIIFTILISCYNKQPKEININFTYSEKGAKNSFKYIYDSEVEFVKTKKTEKGIEISVDRIVTGIPYYGKARISKDTLFLDYWVNIDEDQIPSVAVPLRFKYEIAEVEYKIIKFNFLGNKFKSRK
jgi:hypothetical protein